eukprot:Hpha_TRINITY_DN1562_c0_g2::TRINITY_DN1562_c0_g2_i1::g.57176::m.57176
MPKPAGVPIQTHRVCAAQAVTNIMSASGKFGQDEECVMAQGPKGKHVLMALIGTGVYKASTKTCKAQGYTDKFGEANAAIGLPDNVTTDYIKMPTFRSI